MNDEVREIIEQLVESFDSDDVIDWAYWTHEELEGLLK